nr:hypothetical protein GCM10020092_071270 [Actinoplanes digitatis]
MVSHALLVSTTVRSWVPAAATASAILASFGRLVTSGVAPSALSQHRDVVVCAGVPPRDQHGLPGVRPGEQARVVADRGDGAVGDGPGDADVLGRADGAFGRGRVERRPGEQAALLLEGEDAAHRGVDAGLGELAGGDRAEHGVVRHLHVRGHQQHVDAGLERQHRHPVVAVLLAYA